MLPPLTVLLGPMPTTLGGGLAGGPAVAGGAAAPVGAGATRVNVLVMVLVEVVTEVLVEVLMAVGVDVSPPPQPATAAADTHRTAKTPFIPVAPTRGGNR